MPTHPPVAFLGLGRMGHPMAARLLDAGHEVTAYNRTPEKAAGLVRRGLDIAGTPQEAATLADVVISMVSDNEASRSVWTGDDGVLHAEPAPNALAIECSTLSRAWVVDLAARAEDLGWRYLDAPVTGLPEHAASGTLTFLVGGRRSDLAAVQGLFDVMGSEVLHFGGVPGGTTYKLMINLMGAVQIAAAAEGIALAERAGLDLRVVQRAISIGQAASPQVVRNSQRMVEGNHDAPVTFAAHLRRKDTRYAVELAEEMGVDVRLGAVALAGLDELVAAGLGGLNESSIIEVARQSQRIGRGSSV